MKNQENLFGQKVKKIRESLGYTQKEVQEMCGINRDTLRRIELGVGVPRYDTLQVLSNIYKVDLNRLMNEYKSDENITRYYEKIEEIIIRYKREKLDKIEEELQESYPKEKKSFFNKEVKKLWDTIIGIKESKSHYLQDKETAIDTLKRAMRYEISDFSIKNLKTYFYSKETKYILILIALGLSGISRREEANIIYEFLMEDKDIKCNLKIKMMVELSYNYYVLEEYEKAEEAARKGILICVKNELLYGLNVLYSRKAMAEFIMGSESYLDSLDKSIHIQEIIEKQHA